MLIQVSGHLAYENNIQNGFLDTSKIPFLL